MTAAPPVATVVGRWRPPRGAAAAGGRAGLTLLLALAVLVAVGRTSWAAYATFGAFVSVYGGRRPVSGRWRTKVGPGALLVAATGSGAAVATLPDAAWWSVAGGMAWATGVAAVSDQFRWRPPGPMFPVFAFATCAAIPPGPGTTAAAQVGSAVLVCAATAGLALGLGRLEERAADDGARPWAEPPPHPADQAGPARLRLQALRCAAAVGLAGGLATALGVGRPSWAMVAAVVPLTTWPLSAQLSRGLHRAVGTVVGLVVAALLLLAHPGAAVTVALVGLLQVLTELFVLQAYAVAMVFVTPLSLLVADLGRRQPTGLLLRDRALETALGVVVGLVLAVLTRSRAISPAGRRRGPRSPARRWPRATGRSARSPRRRPG